MHFISELKEYTDDAVLFDTNVFINLEHFKCSQIDLDAIAAVISTDMKPFVTDLSFCEMLIGCRNLEDFSSHMANLNEMEFLFCGSYEPLCSFLSTFDYQSVITEDDLYTLKNKALDYRKDTLFPVFLGVFNFYSLMCFNVLLYLDRDYWYQLYIIYTNFLNSFQKEYQQIVKEIYVEYIDDGKESKEIMKNIFQGFVTSLLTITECQQYKGDDIEVKLNEALTPPNFSQWFTEKNASANKNEPLWLYKAFIVKEKQLINTNNYSHVLMDGILFIVSKLIFDHANFNSHDLIDLYNIDFSVEQEISFHYFTNDRKGKWLDFLKLEKKLHPEIKIYFNY